MRAWRGRSRQRGRRAEPASRPGRRAEPASRPGRRAAAARPVTWASRTEPVPLEIWIRPGDLRVLGGSGGMRVFAGQAAQDRSSVDPCGWASRARRRQASILTGVDVYGKLGGRNRHRQPSMSIRRTERLLRRMSIQPGAMSVCRSRSGAPTLRHLTPALVTAPTHPRCRSRRHQGRQMTTRENR